MLSNPSGTAFALLCAADIAIVCAAAAHVARGGARPVLAIAGAAGLLALKGMAMIAAGLSEPFGVAHVIYLDVVVVAPLAGLVLVALGRRRALRVAGAALLLLAPLGAYASLIEPERLVTERAAVAVSEEREGRAPVRVAVIADLQFERLGDREREVFDRVLAERPDVILMSGDYHQGKASTFAEELPGLRRLVARLRAPGGVFAVQGDSDRRPNQLFRIFGGSRVRILSNTTATTRVRDRRLTIAGLPLYYSSASSRIVSSALEREPGAGDIRILLAHRPDAVYNLSPRTRVDLTVAGHTHGGQIQLPLIGPIEIASDVPRHVGAGGLHEIDGRRIYVSRGIGAERGDAPRARFGAVPELSLLTLR